MSHSYSTTHPAGKPPHSPNSRSNWAYPCEKFCELCATAPLTERLLPADAYYEPFDLAQHLDTNKVKCQDLIAEPDTLSLDGLDLALYPDRRAINLTDETELIEEVLHAEPAFSQGILHLSGVHAPSHAWIQWGCTFAPYQIDKVKPVRHQHQLRPRSFEAN